MRTKNRPNKTTIEFKHLVRNAFDFLSKGIAQFQLKPKFSVINFCAGVELILKARLYREHWTLILHKPETANRKKFHQGDFQSVNLIEVRDRLKNVLDEDVTLQVDCFLKLADHRNRMIHFYHKDEVKQDPQALAFIASEQCLAWYYLHDLMTQKWDRYFNPHSRTIAKLNRAMHGHREYLTTKFNQLTDELKGYEKKDHVIHVCPSCGFRAMISVNRLGDLSQMQCLVCDLWRPYLVIHCPDCQNKVHFHLDYFAAGVSFCSQCGKEFTAETLCKLLDEHHLDDYYETHKRPRCAECGKQTVIQYREKWVCANCLSIFDDIEFCEYCNSNHAGLSMAGSYFNGCPECEGKAGVIASHDD